MPTLNDHVANSLIAALDGHSAADRRLRPKSSLADLASAGSPRRDGGTPALAGASTYRGAEI